MSLASLLSPVWFGSRRNPHSSASKRRTRLAVESLEGRALLTAGFFDTTFNATVSSRLRHTQGRMTFDPGGSSGGLAAIGVQAITVQSNGDIIVAGHAYGGRLRTSIRGGAPYTDIAVARLLPNGQLDRSFGSRGIARLSFGGAQGSDSVSSIAVDLVGRIVVAGTTNRADGSPEAVVERLNANGKLDTSLGSNGRSYFTFDNFSNGAQHFDGFQTAGMTIDGNDNIVVAGTVLETSGYNQFGVARLLINGQFDTSFGAGGQSIDAVYGIDMSQDHVAGLAIDHQGRIVIAGSAQEVNVANGSAVAVLRVLNNGSADPSFGNQAYGHGIIPGIYVDGTSQLPFRAAGVAVNSADQIVVAGDSNVGNSSGSEFLVTRVTASGRTDTSFGISGYSYAPGPAGHAFSIARGVAVDNAGRIIVAGAFQGSVTIQSGLVRLDTNGYFDRSFGSGGISVAGFGHDSGDDALSVALDGSGRILLGSRVFAGGRTVFGVARILS